MNANARMMEQIRRTKEAIQKRQDSAKNKLKFYKEQENGKKEEIQ
jgi:hypothetical protein